MIIEQNLHFLRQGVDLLDSLAAEAYASSTDGRSAVGAHLRHCIDYYRCFLRGLENGRIDYDARERDPRIESEPEVAKAALLEIAARLDGLAPAALERAAEIRVDTPANAPEEMAWCRSTFARELRFLNSHTVHHYALIALLLRQRGIEVSADLGVAPSTLEYRRTVAAAG